VAGNGQFDGTVGVAVDPSGTYVADYGNDRIQFDGNGRLRRGAVTDGRRVV
jgi:hypothetical protein